MIDRRHIVIALLGTIMALLTAPTAILAQSSGPELPCLNCPGPPEQRLRTPLPEAGIWRNPDRSGTGFMLEVQRDRLAGYYYLYDGAGNPVWYAFTGTLEQSEDPEINWTIEALLDRFEGGSCLNCAYQPPDLGQSPGAIRMEFLHRGYARFSVNDAPMQNIVPLTYGISGSRPFQPHANYVLPDLEGYWAFVFQSAPFGSVESIPLILMKPTGSATPPPGIVRYHFIYLSGFPMDADVVNFYGRMDCMADETSGPLCTVTFDETSSPAVLRDRVFTASPGDITHSRIFADEEAGWNLEAFRIGHN